MLSPHLFLFEKDFMNEWMNVFSAEEQAVIRELAHKQELSELNVMRQALRLYEMKVKLGPNAQSLVPVGQGIVE